MIDPMALLLKLQQLRDSYNIEGDQAIIDGRHGDIALYEAQADATSKAIRLLIAEIN